MVGPNLRGIRSSARADKNHAGGHVLSDGGLHSAGDPLPLPQSGLERVALTTPFYNPKTFNTHTVWMATSYAALTYIDSTA